MVHINFDNTAGKIKDDGMNESKAGNKILIVDDSKFSVKILKDILLSEGFNSIAEAGNGFEAIELAGQYKPNYIFLDVEMPVMDGLSALPRLLETHSSAYIIMCTAMGQQNIIEKSIKAGARDYIIKPYKKENIISVINSALAINKERHVIPFDRSKKLTEKMAENKQQSLPPTRDDKLIRDFEVMDNCEANIEELAEYTRAPENNAEKLTEEIENIWDRGDDKFIVDEPVISFAVDAEKEETVLKEETGLQGIEEVYEPEDRAEIQSAWEEPEGKAEIQSIGEEPEGKAEIQGIGEEPESKAEIQGIGEEPEGKAEIQGIGEEAKGKAEIRSIGEEPEDKAETQGIGEEPEGKAEIQGIGEEVEDKAEIQGSEEEPEGKAEIQDSEEEPEGKAEIQGIGEEPEDKAEIQGSEEEPEGKAEIQGSEEEPEGKAEIQGIAEEPEYIAGGPALEETEEVKTQALEEREHVQKTAPVRIRELVKRNKSELKASAAELRDSYSFQYLWDNRFIYNNIEILRIYGNKRLSFMQVSNIGNNRLNMANSDEEIIVALISSYCLNNKLFCNVKHFKILEINKRKEVRISTDKGVLECFKSSESVTMSERLKANPIQKKNVTENLSNALAELIQEKTYRFLT